MVASDKVLSAINGPSYEGRHGSIHISSCRAALRRSLDYTDNSGGV